MKPEDRFLVLVSICIVFLSAVTFYALSKQELVPIQQDSNSVEGVVVHRSGAKVWLLLTKPDLTNNVEAGQVHTYSLVNGTSYDIDLGDLLKGSLLDNETLVTQPPIPFMGYEGDYGFALKGDLVLYSGGKVKQYSNEPYPDLGFSLRNLGEHEITGLRVKINGVQLPYTFDVSKQSPIIPSEGRSWHRYTAWYDTETGNVTGYTPMDGEEYMVEVIIKFDDYTTQTFSSSDVFSLNMGGAISSMVGFDTLYMREPELLSYGSGGGGSLCFWLRNEWYSGGMNEVERLEVYVGHQLVWGMDMLIKRGRYFAALVDVPFDLAQGKNYDVSLVAYSGDGLVSNQTESVLCQYYRIK